VNYALCPIVSIDEIVRQVRASIAWAFRHGGEFGADTSRLTISGHSVGGHLVAMALATDWRGGYGLPPDFIKGAVAISGVYDLGFVPYSYIQPKVQATWDQVLRLSPIRHLPCRLACSRLARKLPRARGQAPLHRARGIGEA
jgi:arylformamidase